MTTTAGPAEHLAPVGEVLRHWRGIRRVSQMDTAHMVHVSPRHLSFVENGHARASRELLQRLGHALDIPLRDRNRLLLATGYAPEFRDLHAAPHHDPAMLATLQQIMQAAEPLPAIVFDRHWNVVALNSGAAIFAEDAAPHLLTPPLSTLRLLVHPQGIGHRIEDRDRLCRSMIHRLERQIAATGDPTLAALHAELGQHLPEATAKPAPASAAHHASDLAESFRIAYRGHALSFISTLAVIGSPRDVLASELAIETFYPADAPTRAFLARPDAIAPEHLAIVRALTPAG